MVPIKRISRLDRQRYHIYTAEYLFVCGVLAILIFGTSAAVAITTTEGYDFVNNAFHTLFH